MAYDEDLADRIRALLAGEPGVEQKEMFGGLAFLVGGHMSVTTSGQDGLMVRVDRGDAEALLREPHAEPVEMRGREMRGWLRIELEGVRTDEQLAAWVSRGVACARALPPKA